MIAIFDVLEHLDVKDIVELLRSCRTHLSEKGHILIRVPSGDSPFSAHLMHSDITHKTMLGSKAIHQISALTDLRVTIIKNAAFPIFGMGISIALQRTALRFIRAVTGKFIKLVFYGNEPMVIYPNMVAVFCKKS